MEFNKGDIVRIKKTSNGYGYLRNDVGIVVKPGRHDTFVVFKSHENLGTADGAFSIATVDLECTIIPQGYFQTPPTPFSIKDVIFNDPAVIVLWNDGTKTVVKCSENDIFDPEKGLAMAISKKALGNQGNYYNTFKKYLAKEKEQREAVASLIAEFWDHVRKGLCKRGV